MEHQPLQLHAGGPATPGGTHAIDIVKEEQIAPETQQLPRVNTSLDKCVGRKKGTGLPDRTR